MKTGFRLVIHRAIPAGDREDCLRFIEGEKKRFLSENSYKTGGWCSGSFFRRGIFGIGLSGSAVPTYTFKRLSKHRRVFGVVPVSELERTDGRPLELNQCMCAAHRGGQRVRLRTGFRDEDFEVLFEHGDIKG